MLTSYTEVDARRIYPLELDSFVLRLGNQDVCLTFEAAYHLLDKLATQINAAIEENHDCFSAYLNDTYGGTRQVQSFSRWGKIDEEG